MSLLIIIIIYSRAKEACESADYNYYIQSCQGGL